jgi:MFS family permease
MTKLQRALLACGIAGGALYPISDILASRRYPGFSYRDMAVSELFAIGAPTSALVVTLFSISSALLLAFAVGIWRAAEGRSIVRWIAVLMALNALDALVLWNFFPMHMRGEAPTFTDTMHCWQSIRFSSARSCSPRSRGEGGSAVTRSRPFRSARRW